MVVKNKGQIIIEAAFKVFSENGFYRTRMEEIAQEAGVGKGTIYEYFENKKHLFEEMCQWHLERYSKNMARNVENLASSTEKLRAIIHNHLIFSSQFKNLISKLINESGSNLGMSPKFKQRMISLYEEKVGEVEKIIEKGIQLGEFRELDAKIAAIFFLDALNGLSHSLFLLKTEMPLEDLADKYLDICINGFTSNLE